MAAALSPGAQILSVFFALPGRQSAQAGRVVRDRAIARSWQQITFNLPIGSPTERVLYREACYEACSMLVELNPMHHAIVGKKTLNAGLSFTIILHGGPSGRKK
eukprot:5981275-Karenia_brevis.AAC.1